MAGPVPSEDCGEVPASPPFMEVSVGCGTLLASEGQRLAATPWEGLGSGACRWVLPRNGRMAWSPARGSWQLPHLLLYRLSQFPDIVEFCEMMANAGKTVIVAALDGTFQRKVSV